MKFVQGVQKEFALQNDTVEGTVVEGDPATALVELAQKESADLIIVGTRGRRGLRRILLGSVSHKVMQLATCAVLTVQCPPWKKRINRPRSVSTF
jgi:nucleotide-binding universal stress UspA family protein